MMNHMLGVVRSYLKVFDVIGAQQISIARLWACLAAGGSFVVDLVLCYYGVCFRCFCSPPPPLGFHRLRYSIMHFAITNKCVRAQLSERTSTAFCPSTEATIYGPLWKTDRKVQWKQQILCIDWSACKTNIVSVCWAVNNSSSEKQM